MNYRYIVITRGSRTAGSGKRALELLSVFLFTFNVNCRERKPSLLCYTTYQPIEVTKMSEPIVEARDQNPLVISHLTLRRAIGVLGMAFPFILYFGGQLGGYDIQSSISSYYHTNMRDVFVGVLWAIAVFMFAYKGHDKFDNILGFHSFIFALGVALLPTTPDNPTNGADPLVGRLHLVSAACFFITLILFCLLLFVRTDESRPMTENKKRRNHVYRICGYTMIACILLIAVYFLFLKNDFPVLEKIKPVFWLEVIALEAFGISWLTKGEAILADEQSE